jgi:Ca-activated chloride channel family protein
MNKPSFRNALPASALAASLLFAACSMQSSRGESREHEAPPAETPVLADKQARPLMAEEAAAENGPSAAKPAAAPPLTLPHSMVASAIRSPRHTMRPVAGRKGASKAAAGYAGHAPAGATVAYALMKKERAGLDSREAPADRFNTEEYSRIGENPFLNARANPLSTFSIDVDAASYANMRRFLQGNSLPPEDAVRIEEIVNYFDYAYPEPEGDAPFSITTEVASAPWNPEHRLVHVGLQGARIENDRLPPSNLVFLLDVSGSMSSPDKLPLLKRAFRLLVDNLRPQDRVAMVVYAGAAGVVLPSTPGSDKAAILGALERLEAGGSTAGGAGIELAYKVARENYREGGNNRIILASDGDFNVGVSSEGELVRLIEEKRKGGVFLSILGFGMGNYKDSKMEKLADRGNGNYAYIDNIREARKVLVEEMGGTLVTLAKDVKLQVEFNPARVEAYRLIGYENRMLRSEDFNDDSKDAGELGAGHSVTALYEIVPAGAGTAPSGVDSLKYQKPAALRDGEAASAELLTVKFRYKDPNGSRSKLLSRSLEDSDLAWERASEDFRFSAAAAGFGMLLRGSEHKGELDYGRVLAMAREARGEDAQGHRAEFIRLVETAKHLSAGRRVGSREP